MWPPRLNRSRRGGTVYLTAADESGMMVSFIQSNYMAFGSGIVVPGTAISLQNRGLMFLDGQSLAECRLAGQSGRFIRSSRRFRCVVANRTELRRDGRRYAAARPCPGSQSHAPLSSATADGVRCATLESEQDFSIDVEPQVSQQTIPALQDLGHVINPLMIAIWISVPDISFGDSILTISIAGSLRRATAVAMVSLRDFAPAGIHAPESISRKPANGALLTLRHVPVALALIEIPNQQC